MSGLLSGLTALRPRGVTATDVRKARTGRAFRAFPSGLNGVALDHAGGTAVAAPCCSAWFNAATSSF
jgi:hypothetical protein